jgi:hypothetical protein
VLISHTGADAEIANSFRSELGIKVSLCVDETWEIEHSSIIKQQPVENWSLRAALNTLRHAWFNLENELLLMKFQHRKVWLRNLLGAIFTNFVAAIPNQSSVRTAQLERILTVKHLDAWRKAAMLSDSVTLVLESDAKQINSAPMLTAIVKFLSQARAPIVVFLSTPFSDEELGVARGNIYPELELQEVLPPRSNTACCYLLNSYAAQILTKFNSKSDLEIRADWLLNKAFSANACSVFFSEVEIIQNASLTSKSSSIRGKIQGL